MQRLHTAYLAESVPVKDYSNEDKASPNIGYEWVGTARRIAFDPLRVVDFWERESGVLTVRSHDFQHSIMMDFDEMLKVVNDANDADEAAWEAKTAAPEKKAAVINVYDARVGDSLSDLVKDGIGSINHGKGSPLQ